MRLAKQPGGAALLVGFVATGLTLALWLVLQSRSGALDPIAVTVFLAGGTGLSVALAYVVYFAIRSTREAREHAATIRSRALVEAALSESEARLRTLLEHAPDAILSVDRTGTIVMANAMTERMFGHAREDLVGQSIEVLVPERYCAEHVNRRAEYVARPRTRPMGLGVELIGRRRDGSEFPVEISLSPIGAGDDLTVMCVVRDVTERKAAERRASTMLRALATIGESATILAHEIKNPLTAVNAALRALGSRLGLEDQAVLQDLVDRMRRVEGMIRRTLSFARPLDLHRTTCRARDVVDLALADLRTLATGRADVARRVDPPDLAIDVDPQLMREVVGNLVANAAEAVDPGGHVAISVAAAHDGAVTITVEDDGPGVPDAMKGKPIQPFVTTKPQGTGLGLSICRKIVEEHGGTLAIADRRPRGTVVTITLPGARAGA
jgi:PAS domain S-box-containing protein